MGMIGLLCIIIVYFMYKLELKQKSTSNGTTDYQTRHHANVKDSNRTRTITC